MLYSRLGFWHVRCCENTFERLMPEVSNWQLYGFAYFIEILLSILKFNWLISWRDTESFERCGKATCIRRKAKIKDS